LIQKKKSSQKQPGAHRVDPIIVECKMSHLLEKIANLHAIESHHKNYFKQDIKDPIRVKFGSANVKPLVTCSK
jgi:hypothetical protein